MINRCSVCNNGLGSPPKETANDSTIIDCHRCGLFEVTNSLLSSLPRKLEGNESRRAVLSHAMHRMRRDSGKPVVLTTDIVKRLPDMKLPSPTEQAETLILRLGEKSAASEYHNVMTPDYGSAIGAIGHEGLKFIVEHLVSEGVLQRGPRSGVSLIARLTFKGWQRFDELKRGKAAGMKAFMAMKFNEPELDRVFNEAFVPAAAEAGFRLAKLDDEPRAGLIDDRMRTEIRTSRFVIADLTHQNAGAYWEAGFAEGLGKPVIYTCGSKEFRDRGTHFDTNHHHTVQWSVENIEQASKLLKATIRATLPDESVLND